MRLTASSSRSALTGSSSRRRSSGFNGGTGRGARRSASTWHACANGEAVRCPVERLAARIFSRSAPSRRFYYGKSGWLGCSNNASQGTSEKGRLTPARSARITERSFRARAAARCTADRATSADRHDCAPSWRPARATCSVHPLSTSPLSSDSGREAARIEARRGVRLAPGNRARLVTWLVYGFRGG
jgi:hypothetical protein